MDVSGGPASVVVVLPLLFLFLFRVRSCSGYLQIVPCGPIYRSLLFFLSLFR